jgi:prevent-host-death family protein
MTTITVDQLREHLEEYLAETARGDVIVTHAGKPWVILRAVSLDRDEGSESLAHSSEFWDLIHRRRQEPDIPWEEAKSQLDLNEPSSEN